MKNYEKYADEIREYKGKDFCKDIVQTHILKEINCRDIRCGRCHTLQLLWMLEEYKEPETDWSKVKVDTPILVSQTEDEDEEWERRHFAKYENGKVYVWSDGCTSWSSEGHMVIWNFAKLAESEEGGAE